MPRTARKQAAPAEGASQPRRPRGGRAAGIRSALQDDIETGALPPGAPLDERALAERFGVSRTPVREALQQLAARDLVQIAPRHGVRVARFSITRMRSMLEFIGELEALCAKLAARRMDADSASALTVALQACRDCAERHDAAAYAAANTHFHEVIYATSRNPYLTDQLRTARRMVQRYHVKYFHTRAQIAKSLHDHEAVSRAILAGDENAATQAMLLHVPAGTTEFSEFLATVPLEFFDLDSPLEV